MAHALAATQRIHTRYPTRDELMKVAWRWDETARLYSITYAFVGTIAARLWDRTDDNELDEMEILVTPETLANGRAILLYIQDRNPTIFVKEAETDQMFITVDGLRVIPMTFIAMNTEYYPNQLIPPVGTQFRRPCHGTLPANVRFMALDYDRPEYRRSIPYVNFRDLLRQRLLRFAPNVEDERVQRRNRRDMEDIIIFLRGSAVDQDNAFPVGVAFVLHPTILRWLDFAMENFVPPTGEMVAEFNRLLGATPH